jgi:hypothetical protein
VSPVAPPLPDIHVLNPHQLEAMAVRLTAGWTPFEAWQNAFNTTSANASTLTNNFFLAPGVGLQQAIVNQVGYLNQVLNDPSSLGSVLTQIANNVQTVATGITGVNPSEATATAVQAHTLDALHGALVSLLPEFLPPDIDAGIVTKVLQVLSSPLSGLLIGAVGPVIAPGVALLNSALAVGAALQASDPAAALTHLLDTPANMVNAFFNGADLDLTALTPLINQSGVLPAGTTLDALDFAFGGLFSVGSVSQGSYTQGGTLDPGITTPGGSILNSLGLTITTDALGVPITLPIPSNPVGPIGALQAISQKVGVLLGDHWDGKDAVQVPPLSTLHFPTLSTMVADVEDVEDTAAVTAEARTTAPEEATAKLASLSTSGTTESTPKTETIGESSPDATSTATPPSTADSTDATKTAAAPESTGATTGTSGGTSDSATKTDSTTASNDTKSSDAGTDTTPGNKAKPRKRAGSDAPKSGDTASAKGGTDATAGKADSSNSAASGGEKAGGAEKASAGKAKGADAASHGRHAK